MRIDLDTRLTLAYAGGWGILVGEAVVGILGGTVNDAVVGGAVTLVVATLGVGAVLGGKASNGDQTKEEDAG